MKERYEQESGFEVDEASDIAIRLKVLAGEIYNMQTTLDWTKRQMFAATATSENLDNLAAQRGLTRKAAVKATGQITFRLSETLNYAVPIPRGTVVGRLHIQRRSMPRLSLQATAATSTRTPPRFPSRFLRR